MAFCSACGTAIPEGAGTCPKCGAAGRTQPAGTAAAAPAPAAGGLTDNVAGMIAYITIIPAIIFLLVAPYNTNRFIRFHSFQNIFLHVAAIAIWIVLFILSIVASVIPVIGHVIVFLLGMLVWLGFAIVWILLLIKAYQGQMWKLPVIGDMAEKQANAV
jgi:uncharacterized membrane protein